MIHNKFSFGRLVKSEPKNRKMVRKGAAVEQRLKLEELEKRITPVFTAGFNGTVFELESDDANAEEVSISFDAQNSNFVFVFDPSSSPVDTSAFTTFADNVGTLSADDANSQDMTAIAVIGGATNSLALNVDDLLGADSAVPTFESLSAIGGSAADTMNASQQTNANISLEFSGAGGDDTLTGGAGNSSLNGGDGADLITAGSGNALILGDAGDDVLTGGTGNDSIVWNEGDGNDTITGGGGNDTVQINSGAGLSEDFVIEPASDVGRVSIQRITATAFTLDLDGPGLVELNTNDGDDTITIENLPDVVGLTGFFINFESGNDLLDASAQANTVFPMTVLGGEGDDTLTGSSASNLLVGGDGLDEIVGGTGNDTILGGADADSLSGGEGDDSIMGDFGMDTITGGDGADTIFGGADADSILGQDGADTVRGDDGDDTIDGGLGADTLDGSDQNDVIVGGVGADCIGGGAGNDSILGGDDADTIVGVGGSDTILGGAGSDSISGGNDADSILGEDGDDIIRGDGGDDTVDGGLGADNISGGNDNDVLLGDAGADTISGANGADSILGGDDNDSILGEGGDDTILGGEGGDFLSGGDGADSVLGENGQDTILGEGGNDTLRGGEDADSISGGDGNDSIDGGAGADTILGGIGADSILAGDGNDSILGEDGADTISGDGGDDTIDGGLGTDLIAGGVGADRLIGGSDADTILGGDDNDTIDGGAGNDSLDGGAGIDILVGTNDSFTLNDTTLAGAATGTDAIVNFENASLVGSAGNDSFDTTGFTIGSVTLFGAAGDDTFTTNVTNDFVIGGDGIDRVVQVGGSFTLANNSLAGTTSGSDLLDGVEEANLVGSAGNDVIDASAFTGSTTLIGGAGDDVLTGGPGDDFLDGGAGNDTLTGGAGSDTLIGGDGNDAFFAADGFLDLLFVDPNELQALISGVNFDANLDIINGQTIGETIAEVTSTKEGPDVFGGQPLSAVLAFINNFYVDMINRPANEPVPGSSSANEGIFWMVEFVRRTGASTANFLRAIILGSQNPAALPAPLSQLVAPFQNEAAVLLSAPARMSPPEVVDFYMSKFFANPAAHSAVRTLALQVAQQRGTAMQIIETILAGTPETPVFDYLAESVDSVAFLSNPILQNGQTLGASGPTFISGNSTAAPSLAPIADQTIAGPVTLPLVDDNAASVLQQYTATVLSAGLNPEQIANLRIVGDELTIEPVAGFVGSFEVEVTASLGGSSATKVFQVTVIEEVVTQSTAHDPHRMGGGDDIDQKLDELAQAIQEAEEVIDEAQVVDEALKIVEEAIMFIDESESIAKG